MVDCILANGGEYLKDCTLFDVYTGSHIAHGMKSVAFSLTMRSDDQTLTDDHAEETVAKVLAGTDDRCERTGIMGGTVYYAAEKVKDGYARKDGKHFNMSYVPEKILGREEEKHVIRPEKN